MDICTVHNFDKFREMYDEFLDAMYALHGTRNRVVFEGPNNRVVIPFGEYNVENTNFNDNDDLNNLIGESIISVADTNTKNLFCDTFHIGVDIKDYIISVYSDEPFMSGSGVDDILNSPEVTNNKLTVSISFIGYFMNYYEHNDDCPEDCSQDECITNSFRIGAFRVVVQDLLGVFGKVIMFITTQEPSQTHPNQPLLQIFRNAMDFMVIKIIEDASPIYSATPYEKTVHLGNYTIRLYSNDSIMDTCSLNEMTYMLRPMVEIVTTKKSNDDYRNFGRPTNIISVKLY